MLLLVHFTQAQEDYWDEDFDVNKNCVREEEIQRLQRETEPGRSRCAETGKFGKLEISSAM